MNSKKKFLNSLGIWGLIGFVFLVVYLIGKYSNFIIVPHVIFYLIPFAFIYTFSPLIYVKKPFLEISNYEIKYFGDFRFNSIHLNNIKSYMIDKEKSFLHFEVINSKEPISINLSEIKVGVEDIEMALKEVFKT